MQGEMKMVKYNKNIYYETEVWGKTEAIGGEEDRWKETAMIWEKKLLYVDSEEGKKLFI